METANKSHSPMRILWREICSDKLALFSLFFFITVVTIVFIWAGLLDPRAVLRQDLRNTNIAPNSEFWLGTDHAGRNVFNLLIVGARNSFIIAFTLAIASSLIGITVGLIAGFYAGTVDNIIMRIIDFLTMIPGLMLILTLIVILPDSVFNFGLILTILGWLGMARTIRMITLQQGAMDYVKASKTLGTRNPVIIVREVVPNILSFMVVNLTLAIAGTMGVETGLTFLGFGLPPDMPSLGTLIATAASPLNMQLRPWLWLPAALFVLVMMLCINYVGQALNRAADARRRRV
ncbi:MAG: ABC transporter permease [Defluviitaleaceae bacterium]|nr:ABC transporter permease [Defluviitaleaceae bacterium]